MVLIKLRFLRTKNRSEHVPFLVLRPANASKLGFGQITVTQFRKFGKPNLAELAGFETSSTFQSIFRSQKP